MSVSDLSKQYPDKTRGTRTPKQSARKEEGNPVGAEISLFRNIQERTASEKTCVLRFALDVKLGTYHRDIQEIRDLLEQGQDQQAETLKRRLPAVSLSGIVTEGARARAHSEGRFRHSGYLQGDFDTKDFHPRSADDIKATLAEDKHIQAVFLSARCGVKAIIRIPVCETPAEHTAAFIAAEKYFREKYELKLDASTKDPVRLCYVSDDADAYVKHSPATAIPVAAVEEASGESKDRVKADTSGKECEGNAAAKHKKLTEQEIRCMLACIPTRPDYDIWLKVSSAVWAATEDEAIGSALLKEWSPEEEPGEYSEKFPDRLIEITAGTLVYLAREHGYKTAPGWKGGIDVPVPNDVFPLPAGSEADPRFHHNGAAPASPEGQDASQAAATASECSEAKVHETLAPEEALQRFHYDARGKYHLLTDSGAVPMDLTSVIRHLKTRGIKDIPASGDFPGEEVIDQLICAIQTARFIQRADDINLTEENALLQQAYAMAFDPNDPPPEDELRLVLGEYPIAASGNLTVFQGKSKVGKSSAISAALGAIQRGDSGDRDDELLCFRSKSRGGGTIIHLDTEQSLGDWHALVRRSVTRSGLPEVSNRLVSIPLVRFARSERLKILELVLEKERREKGGIDAVIIDGVADLCSSPNDEAESLELVSRLHALAQEYSAPFFLVLHENPSGEGGKTRGHLGSELNRKAFANLRIDKDADTTISTMWGLDMRKRDIPQNQGFCFAWDDEAGMHVFQGRAAGIKAAKREQKAVEEAREKWGPIFDFVTEDGTNATRPTLSAGEAAEAIRDMDGTKNSPKVETIKKQMQRAEGLGVLRKVERGRWALKCSGTNGT